MAQAPPVVCGVKQGPGPPPVTGNTDRLCNDGDDWDTPGDGDEEEVQCTAAQQTGRRWGQGSAAARVLLLLLLLLWHNQVTQLSNRHTF